MNLNPIAKAIAYSLRDYQQEAVDHAISYIRQNSEPVLLELATGAGKSLICAELARILISLSGKKVLCLCPTSELVEQNAEKFSLTGEDFSIYSASIGKSLRHNVIFATEGTFKKVAEEQGHTFSTVIIDEAHKITPTIKKIIADMRKGNKNLRIIGMTATPYRLGTGYIYEIDQSGSAVDKSSSKNPYFKQLIYAVGGAFLVEKGYLTKPVIGKIGADKYDTDNLKLGKNFTFNHEDLDQAFVGQGKKTSAIVADVVSQSNAMGARGVMFFASTIEHAEEVLASLPAYNSALVTGETPKAERKRIIADYKAQKIKYLVNVSVLTTGFDAPHTDVVAILRATESASLLSQIIGRGLRLFEGKEFCLILDYAGNIEKFYPDGDLFNPQIEAYGEKETAKIDCICEKCNSINKFSLRPNPSGNSIDENGYFSDQYGERVMIGDGDSAKPMPAHFGRRCTAVTAKGHNIFERCDYFWTFKECPECGQDNDIAARKCSGCGVQLIDPNNKLSIDFEKFKMDLTQVQTDLIKSIIKKKVRPDLLLAIIETHYRTIEVFFSKRANSKFYETMCDKAFIPKTISYRKQTADSKYFIVSDFNREEDRQ